MVGCGLWVWMRHCALFYLLKEVLTRSRSGWQCTSGKDRVFEISIILILLLGFLSISVLYYLCKCILCNYHPYIPAPFLPSLHIFIEPLSFFTWKSKDIKFKQLKQNKLQPESVNKLYLQTADWLTDKISHRHRDTYMVKILVRFAYVCAWNKLGQRFSILGVHIIFQ